MRSALLAVLLTACGADGPPWYYPPATTQLVVHVTEGAGGPAIPSRIVLYDSGGAMVRIGTLDMFGGQVQDRGFCQLADGAVGTWMGIALARGDAEIPIGVPICDASIPIPYGVYHARIMRGAEYEIFETDVDLRPHRGKVMLEAPLTRAFATDGTLAADLHVHASDSGDSNLPRNIRVITEAAAGIQVIGSSDHNYNADYADDIAALGMGAFVASLPGNEVTINIGHFNAFPMDAVDPHAPMVQLGWSEQQLTSTVRALPQHPFLFINHPRLGFAAYFDMAGWDGVSWPPPMPVDFDGLEVLTGWTAYDAPGDARLDKCVTDFYTLISHGQLLTALGNSDTHHLNNILAGFPRTYVRATLPFDELAFVDALRARHAVATTGPWMDVRVDGTAGPGDQVTNTTGTAHVHIDVRQASYVHATTVTIHVGAQTMRLPLAPIIDRDVTIGSTDTWIGVDVSGTDPLPADLVGDYLTAVQHTPGMMPFAIINPILVDANGDGQVSFTREHARMPTDFRAPPNAHPADCGEP